MNEEWKAWREMCKAIREAINLSEGELNDKKYRPMFEMIERWAFYDRERREALREEGSKYADTHGSFWKGKQET